MGDSFVTGFGERYEGTSALAALKGLPDDVAIAFGGGLADGWGERAIIDNTLAFGSDREKMLAEFEKATGLTAADLEDLGGESLGFVAAPGFEKALSFDGDAGTGVPVAARVTGDIARIEAALNKVREKIGKDAHASGCCSGSASTADTGR